MQPIQGRVSPQHDQDPLELLVEVDVRHRGDGVALVILDERDNRGLMGALSGTIKASEVTFGESNSQFCDFGLSDLASGAGKNNE